MSVAWRVKSFLRISAAYVYRLGIVPIVGFLPAVLAYRLACLKGDLCYHRDAITRQRIIDNLADVLGEQLGPTERARATRDFFRARYCRAVDELRLRGRGRALARLVEVRGLEHLEAALAAGHGALLCTAHYGSFVACLSLLGAHGFPITSIMRDGVRADPHQSRLDHLSGRVFSGRTRQMQPKLNPDQGQFAVALQAARVLQRNELLGIFIDPPALPADHARTIRSDLLGRHARFLAGSMIIAQRAGSPVHVALLHRSPDWRHQVLEISASICVEGDPAAAFQRCISIIDRAIRNHPGNWIYWNLTSDLIDLGIMSQVEVGAST